MSNKTDAWKALREETLLNLDIRQTYEGFGVKFTGKVSSSNWAECHAFGREDKSPSAAVNLTTGVYKDFGGDRLSIFDFMMTHGKAASWQEAQEILAKSVGLAKKIPKKSKAKRPEEQLGFTSKFTLVSVVPMARQYGIDPRAIEMTGARIARYPASSQEPQIVCAFPVYDSIGLLEKPPESYVLQSGSGQPIMVYQGPDAPAKPEKRIVIGATGVLNRFALEHWDEAERVYKVEGLSDMLVLQAFIPDEFRTKHLVITNACGCDDAAPAWGLAPHMAGKEFVVIHDADIPGQYGTGKQQDGGAQRWVKAMKQTAKSVKNVQLPYELASKHGKDLRDWIGQSGRKYSDLLELVNATKDEVSGKKIDGTGSVTERTPEQLILDRLGLHVLGHIGASGKPKAIIYNFAKSQKTTIDDINKWTYYDMLTIIGDTAKTEIDNSPEPSPAKVSVNAVKQCIAFEAGKRRMTRDNTVGVGMWELAGKLICIGSGRWLAMNGDLMSSNMPEIGDRVIDFGEGTDSWFNEDQIRNYLPHAVDSAWRTEFLKEFAEIFSRWNNWDTNPNAAAFKPFIVAALCLCSWCQDIWTWCPWISVIGETNSGKTALFSFLSRYFGPQMTISTSNATEAGLRQSLGTTSRVLLLDEFEHSRERIKILDWLKGAGAGGGSVRGTPGQGAVKAKVKAIPWLGAIEAKTANESERNRYIMFQLTNRIGKRRFKLPDDDAIEVLRNKSLAVIFRCWVRAKELHEYLMVHHQIQGLYDRYTQTYSLPVAMWGAVSGLSNEETGELFAEWLGYMIEPLSSTSEAEHVTLLNEILYTKVRLGRGEELNIQDLLTSPSHRVSGNETPDQILERQGIRKMGREEFKKPPEAALGDKFIFVAHAIVRRELLKFTGFAEKSIDQILERVPGAFRCKQRLGAVSPNGIAIPWDEVFGDFSPADAQREAMDREGFVPPSERTLSSDVFGD